MIKCKKCEKVILEDETRVDLITSKSEKELEHIYFHLQCWKDHNVEQQSAAIQSFEKKQDILRNQILGSIKNRFGGEMPSLLN